MEGERERERERERNISVWLLLAQPLRGTWPKTQACALTGNGTGNPLACRPALNPLGHTSQGWTRSFLNAPFLHMTKLIGKIIISVSSLVLKQKLT